MIDSMYIFLVDINHSVKTHKIISVLNLLNPFILIYKWIFIIIIIFFDELVIFIPLYHHTYFSSKYIVASVPEGALIFAPSFDGDDIILGDMPHLGIVIIVVADTSTIEIKKNTVAT